MVDLIACHVDMPKGYEAESFRLLREGDLYLAWNSDRKPYAARYSAGYAPHPGLALTKIKYRGPVMPDDYGSDIEVRDTEADGWKAVKFCGYLNGMDLSYVDGHGVPWRYARVRDTK
jgi:hypothetical protein